METKLIFSSNSKNRKKIKKNTIMIGNGLSHSKKRYVTEIKKKIKLIIGTDNGYDDVEQPNWLGHG